MTSWALLLALLAAAAAVEAASNADGSEGRATARWRRQASRGACRRGQWQCKDRGCIASHMRCDGRADCKDKSDETAAQCGRIKCDPHLFQCSYGACVDGDAKCNNVDDCVDRSDELNRDCMPKVAAPNTCGKKFRCDNGECVAKHMVCDGAKDCSDGSDETLLQCSTRSCESFLFRCAYGACVDGDAFCNGIANCADGSDEDPLQCRDANPAWQPPVTAAPPATVPPFFPVITPSPPPPTAPPTGPSLPAGPGDCQLPPYPEDGIHRAPQFPNLKPGDWIGEYNILTYSCKKGYGTPSTDIPLCTAGSWTITPRCIRLCTLPKSFTVKFSCERAGQAVTCEEKIPEGVKLLAECITGHYSEDQLDVLECVEGSWDYSVPKCKPDCGLEKGRGETYSVNSQIATKDSFPWHVGIYQEIDVLTQVCGGSLLHPHIVISAAHCFWDSNANTRVGAEYFKVAAGKFYRDYITPLDQFAQKSDVKSLHLHERYQGDTLSQSNDLALVSLKVHFSINNHVRPVCYDWNNERLNEIHVATNSMGKVAGWGRTETGEPSVELRTVTIPVIEYNICFEEMKKFKFERYLTTDKLCAGYTNGTALCNGDSGGGLVFKSTDLFGLNRWYIRGVVSNGPTDLDKGFCRAETYTAFTQIFKLRDWVIKTLKTLNTAS